MSEIPQIAAIELALREIKQAARLTIPRAVAKMAADHFTENFRRGGFVNSELQKWKDVRRRDPSNTAAIGAHIMLSSKIKERKNLVHEK